MTYKDHSSEKAVQLYSRDKIRRKLSCLGHLILLLFSISLLRLYKTLDICTRKRAGTLIWLKLHPAKKITLSTYIVPQVHHNCTTYCASTHRGNAAQGSCGQFLLHTVSMSANRKYKQHSKL